LLFSDFSRSIETQTVLLAFLSSLKSKELTSVKFYKRKFYEV